MSDSSDFKLQVSLKFGAEGSHMINVRADNWPEMADLLAGLKTNKAEIEDVAAMLPLSITPRVTFQKKTGAPQPQPVSGEAPTIVKIQVDTANKAGKPFRNPKGWIKLSDGRQGSTFDPLLIAAARTLHSDNLPVRAEFEQTPEGFTNLTQISRAG
jgi:hypothetical protein